MGARTRRGVELWLKQQVYDDPYSSPSTRINILGKRIRRIIFKHLANPSNTRVYDPGNDTFGRCLLIEGEKNVKGFKDTATAQRTIDKYLNAKITLQLTTANVLYKSGGIAGSCKDLAHVRQAWAQGKQIEVRLIYHELSCTL